MHLNHIRKGDGEPLLLVHGLGSQLQVWQAVIDRLTDRFEVVSIDLPGFGGSPPLPDGREPSAVELTGAVAAFLDEIGWERPHVAGNSLGGWIGLELAKRDRARTVAAIGPAGFGNRRERAFTTESLRLTRRFAQLIYGVAPVLLRSPLRRKVMLGQFFARAERMPAEAAVEAVRNLADSPGVPGALEALRRGRFSGGEEIDVPVTMIWGDSERLLPRRERQAARSVRMVPGARLVWLRGCGHTPMWDDPAQVAGAIMRSTEG